MKAPLTKKQVARRIVRAFEKDLSDRCGVKNGVGIRAEPWIRREQRKTWMAIVEEALALLDSNPEAQR